MNIKRKAIIGISIGFLAIFMFFACKSTKNNNQVTNDLNKQAHFDTVHASIETPPVKSVLEEDAADDPAIWIHPTDVSKSLVIGSNKKAGIHLYNLKGQELGFYPEGLVNNVDVIYNVEIDGKKYDLVGGSNRSFNGVSLLLINQDSLTLKPLLRDSVSSKVEEVYGFCMYTSPVTGKPYLFVNGKNGTIEQFKIKPGQDFMVELVHVRDLHVDSQPEGMVADLVKGILYVGEENRGIWKFNAEPGEDTSKTFVKMSGTDNPAIDFDMEGVTIYYAGPENGYLLASSQGNNSYAIFERQDDNKYLGSFRISGGTIDGAEETDGIDVLNLALGDDFPDGVFIAQDGFNYKGNSLEQQNFKLVKWTDIVQEFEHDLVVNDTFNLREF